MSLILTHRVIVVFEFKKGKFAKKYSRKTIGYEATKTAHDINPQEYDPYMTDVWAVRLYKIS